MTWVKLDDKLHGHHKVQRAWREEGLSLGLHLLALSYAGAYDTDGHIPDWFLAVQLPSPQRRRRAVQALLGAGLWEIAEGGFLIHDFLDYNASREQMLKARDPSRGRTRAQARAHTRVPATRPVPNPFSSLHPSIKEASA